MESWMVFDSSKFGFKKKLGLREPASCHLRYRWNVSLILDRAPPKNVGRIWAEFVLKLRIGSKSNAGCRRQSFSDFPSRPERVTCI